MKNDSLSHGKKNTGTRAHDCDLKNNVNSRRSEDISSSGIEFHKSFSKGSKKPEDK